MDKTNVEEFDSYEVYELIEGNYHCICVCKEYNMAALIAQLLAKEDPSCDAYYVSSVNYPGDFVPGGGWYDSWRKDKETSVLKKSSLS